MLALLGAHVAGRGAEMAGALRTAADLAEAALPELERAVEPVAEAYAGADRMYAVARGIEVATAAEVALKLTEVAYVGARALTATSLAHGPVAALDATFPVWAVASDDATLPAVAEAVQRARDAGAPVIATGPAAGARQGPRSGRPAAVAEGHLGRVAGRANVNGGWVGRQGDRPR